LKNLFCFSSIDRYRWSLFQCLSDFVSNRKNHSKLQCSTCIAIYSRRFLSEISFFLIVWFSGSHATKLAFLVIATWLFKDRSRIYSRHCCDRSIEMPWKGRARVALLLVSCLCPKKNQNLRLNLPIKNPIFCAIYRSVTSTSQLNLFCLSAHSI